jgi:hypothetical protein
LFGGYLEFDGYILGGGMGSSGGGYEAKNQREGERWQQSDAKPDVFVHDFFIPFLSQGERCPPNQAN